jgi:hypothetical protein
MARFRERDIARAVKAATKAGLRVSGVRISPCGEIVVEAGNPLEQPSSPLDEWMAKHARQAEGN